MYAIRSYYDEIRVRDIYEGIEERDVDRIVLDLPEPWHVVPHAAQALAPGGIFLSYLPSTIQVKQMVDRVEEQGGVITSYSIHYTKLYEPLWRAEKEQRDGTSNDWRNNFV